MNKDRKKRGTTYRKFLMVVAIGALFLNNGSVMATQNTENNSYGVTEQLQSVSVTGLVVDSNGEPVIGASVVEKGTTNGVVTNVDGNFSLSVRQGATLRVTFIGYRPQDVKAAGSMKIVLLEDTELLDEVVVVGYSTQKKANLTGAVTTVDVSKSLEARPQSDVTKALQGVVPGLSIINSSGAINKAPSITIRGTGTLSNGATSNPLIVVDGVPMDDISYLNTQDIENISVLKDAASTSIYGTRAAFGVLLITTKAAKKTDKITINYTNNFAWETPTVLPDYPDVPTQIKGMIAVSERMNASPQLFGMNLISMLPKTEAWQQKHGGKTGYREMVLGDDFDIDPNTGVGSYYADWDVVGIMYRKWKPSQSHNVSIQGTSGKTSYYMSLGYNHNEGVMAINPDKLDKWTVNMNVTSDVTDWLQIGGRFSYNDKTFDTPATQRNTFEYLWRWGSFFGPYGTYEGSDFRNDIAYRKQAGENIYNNTYTRLGGFLRAKIVKGLILNADYTFNVMNGIRRANYNSFTSYDSWGGDVRAVKQIVLPSSSYVRRDSERDKSYALNIYANYEFNLAKKHNFNIMLGGNAEEGEKEMSWSRRNYLLDENLPEFPLAIGEQTVNGSHSEWGACGYFGRINYDYNGIWLLELNGRYDGSSKFPEADRWAFFPSGSFGYRLSEEAYFESVKQVVNNAKLRASYGEIGNQAVGNNMYISTLASGNANWLDASGNKFVSYGIPSLVSSTLKWERIQTLDIGGDFGFLNNDLGVSFDWYQRTTKDMLAPGQTMPEVLGAGAPRINAGTLRTRGWELSIDYRHSFNDLNVYANFNIGDFSTTVTKWDNDTRFLNTNFSGKKYGDIWGFETERLYQKEDFEYGADGKFLEVSVKDGKVVPNGTEGSIVAYKLKNGAYQHKLQQGSFLFGPGDIKFKDLNGDGQIDAGDGTPENHGDLKVIGNTTPRYQYSFRLGGEWRGFDLDMFFQGVGKRAVWTTSYFVMPMMRGVDALYANQTDYWTEENTDAYYPRLFSGNTGQGTISSSIIEGGNHNFYPQSKFLVNMAYLRFKNLTVGYTLPKVITRQAYLDKVRFYFSANNICELINKSNAPVDPEINESDSGSLTNGKWGTAEPMSRTISFGVQVTF
ncbi:SusC/RagA family TonB-linked outer membrane protein [Bacteroides sp. UBA939]|uniref:SusC/RagA family TonB-linked outer membrane protein n=1 Tax=Bacteroides sp. UBA939 TaxID=1946092 RepID=UPI0025BC3419|nr:TonB-dependent receptor [Bacteroides sp. UBA939]